MYPDNWDEIREIIYKRDNYTCQNCKNKYCINEENIYTMRMETKCSPVNIELHFNDNQQQTLISLSKGSTISFEGTITNKIYPPSRVSEYSSLDVVMYNGKIIN